MTRSLTTRVPLVADGQAAAGRFDAMIAGGSEGSSRYSWIRSTELTEVTSALHLIAGLAYGTHRIAQAPSSNGGPSTTDYIHMSQNIRGKIKLTHRASVLLSLYNHNSGQASTSANHE